MAAFGADVIVDGEDVNAVGNFEGFYGLVIFLGEGLRGLVEFWLWMVVWAGEPFAVLGLFELQQGAAGFTEHYSLILLIFYKGLGGK